MSKEAASRSYMQTSERSPETSSMTQAPVAVRPLTVVMNRLSAGAIAIAGSALVGMAIVEVWQVFARYVLNNSPSWTEPLALLLMTTAMMFGAAAGVRANRHFGFFIVVEHARPPVQRVLR